MSAVTGIVAGLITAAGAVALYRYAQRRANAWRDKLDRARESGSAKPVIEFEQDPETGTYHAK